MSYASEIESDVALVGQLDCVPTLLSVLCEVTGMGFAAVVRVTDDRWTACAVLDRIGFGLLPGGQLDLATTLCKEVRSSGTAIVIEHASLDPVYSQHPTPKLYAIESYVSVPVVLPGGDFFGTLCAVDRQPAQLRAPGIAAMFAQFAELIGKQLQNQRRARIVQTALMAERSAKDLHEQLVDMLGHDLRVPIGAIALSSQRLKACAGDPAAVLRIASDITAHTKHAGSVICEALDSAHNRVEGRLTVEPTLVERIDEALFGVVTEMQSAHQGRDIEWAFDVTRPVQVDRARIQQLAAYLLINALDHSAPSGKTRITASTLNGEFGLSVWSDRKSIIPDKVDDAFAPLWRVDSVGAGQEGLGLELHISSQIVKAHGGRLSVASGALTGTTIMAVMPA